MFAWLQCCIALRMHLINPLCWSWYHNIWLFNYSKNRLRFHSVFSNWMSLFVCVTGIKPGPFFCQAFSIISCIYLCLISQPHRTCIINTARATEKFNINELMMFSMNKLPVNIRAFKLFVTMARLGGRTLIVCLPSSSMFPFVRTFAEVLEQTTTKLSLISRRKCARERKIPNHIP